MIKTALTAAFESLTTASHKLAEVMYQSEQADGAAGGDAGGDAGSDSNNNNNNNDDVIDAEYSDVDA